MGKKVNILVGYKYGEGEHLTVVDRIKTRDRRGKGKAVYVVSCSVCEQDPELFGDGKFESAADKINLGYRPCGCTGTYAWSDAQNEIRAKRQCMQKGWTFISLVENSKTGKPKAKLECSLGHQWDVVISALPQISKGCIKCSGRIPEEDAISRFQSNSIFLPGTMFTRSSKPDEGRIWFVTCPKCSVDEYALAGCETTFRATLQSLTQGSRPCRCATKHKRTQQETEFEIKQLCGKHNLSFLGWSAGYKTQNSKFWIHCPEHDAVETKGNNFFTSSTKCPKCAKGGFKEHRKAFVYVLKIVGVSGDFTGYGVTNFPESRIHTHECAVGRSGFMVEGFKVFEVPSNEAINIEQGIKDKFPLHSQDITGFKTEATFIKYYNEVVSFVRDYLDTLSSKTPQLKFLR